MGTVWLAERADGAFRKDAAVKVLNRDVVSPALVRRFLRERQILADLEHPNICRLFDGGTAADGRPYLVMERVEGEPLDRYFQQRDATQPEILRVFIKLCDALGFAHARGIIHRDLKPSNVMVTDGGEPKVLDFGIARLRENAESVLTQTGEMALTPSYASPEQWRGEAQDPTSDVFSLGVILFELLTGSSSPAPGLQGVPRDALVRSGVGEHLQAVLLGAVHERADQRYSTMARFADALREILDGPSRAESRPLRVFISCRGDVAADLELALRFYDALADAGASAFLAPKNTTGDDCWVQAVTQAMSASDVLLLLLSPQAAVSEMVAREVELAHRLDEARADVLRIVPVKVRFPEGDAQLHPVQEYLQGLEHSSWHDGHDTARIVRRVLGHAEASTSPQAPASLPIPAHVTTADEHVPPVELPGGIVSPDSPFYVVRAQLEKACLNEIVRRGALVRIKGSRQMGKTSLMMRLLDHAASDGSRTVAINLQLCDNAILGDLGRFLRWLCAAVSRRLRLPTRALDEEWDDLFGAKDNCSAYLEGHVLTGSDALVLAIDHVDRVFEFPHTAEEFLSLLRAWNEMGTSQAPWNRLRLVLVYATEMYLPMNINRSPFNVGLPVALSEWDAGMVGELARRHGLALDDQELGRLMEVLSGHPHLIRVALYHLALGTTLEEVLDRAATDDGLFSDHLKSLLWHLQANPELGKAAAEVMAADAPVRLSTELAFKLASLGLVRLKGNDVCPARELYRRYLEERL
ncbi:MAG: AAA-like domain-containing protein [Myxococcales bacterium]|nr:AAA-like domain-containing protein [Myxococcales bacterium]